MVEDIHRRPAPIDQQRTLRCYVSQLSYSRPTTFPTLRAHRQDEQAANTLQCNASLQWSFTGPSLGIDDTQQRWHPRVESTRTTACPCRAQGMLVLQLIVKLRPVTEPMVSKLAGYSRPRCPSSLRAGSVLSEDCIVHTICRLRPRHSSLSMNTGGI